MLTISWVPICRMTWVSRSPDWWFASTPARSSCCSAGRYCSACCWSCHHYRGVGHVVGDVVDVVVDDGLVDRVICCTSLGALFGASGSSVRRRSLISPIARQRRLRAVSPRVTTVASAAGAAGASSPVLLRDRRRASSLPQSVSGAASPVVPSGTGSVGIGRRIGRRDSSVSRRTARPGTTGRVRPCCARQTDVAAGLGASARSCLGIGDLACAAAASPPAIRSATAAL